MRTTDSIKIAEVLAILEWLEESQHRTFPGLCMGEYSYLNAETLKAIKAVRRLVECYKAYDCKG